MYLRNPKRIELTSFKITATMTVAVPMRLYGSMRKVCFVLFFCSVLFLAKGSWLIDA